MTNNPPPHSGSKSLSFRNVDNILFYFQSKANSTGWFSTWGSAGVGLFPELAVSASAQVRQSLTADQLLCTGQGERGGDTAVDDWLSGVCLGLLSLCLCLYRHGQYSVRLTCACKVLSWPGSQDIL